MKHKTLRPAIAMIELIFAIVIMAIVLMSAPMLIHTATESNVVAIQQEGINEGASRVFMIMGYPWDENNTQDDYVPPILHVTDGDPALNEVGTTGRRIGIPELGSRSFIMAESNNSQNELNASVTLGIEGTVIDDMDDFGGTSLTQIQAATTDYTEKTTVSIATSLAYNVATPNSAGTFNQTIISFTPFTTLASPAGKTTNIKSITVNVTSTTTTKELQKNIVLRGFSCNIGGYELKERSF